MDFSDISAYEDRQVAGVLEQLLNNRQFMEILHEFKSLPEILSPGKSIPIETYFKKIESVDAFQGIMFALLNDNITKTTRSLSYSGIENLPEDSSFLFVSNHRSTSLDASYLNYILHFANRVTVYSGAGDNIFETDWLGHLIRLNKGFIIKRDVPDIDDKIIEAERLSRYIYSLLKSGRSVWISQQPGRAKNGMDKTDSVIITMLNKYQSGDKNYSEWLEEITLIPLCISWESIPCGLQMAKELNNAAEKSPFSDMRNILEEINSYKGNVHYHFCKRVQGKSRSEIVRLIDEQIINNYQLWDTNWLAFLKTTDVSGSDKKMILKSIDEERTEKIFSEVLPFSAAVQKSYYEMYAHPVKSALQSVNSLGDLLEIHQEKEKQRERVR